MSWLSDFSARHLRTPFRRVRRLYRRVRHPDGYFRSVTLDDRAIETAAYESYLLGSGDAWRGHGAFQLFFLRAMGMEPSHRLLDIGCGPLRGGIHAIAYLDRGRYCGIDYNASFIRAAQQRVDAEGLAAKLPVLRVIDGFELDPIAERFDFALAFSVLNHCNADQRRRFFDRVPERLQPDARLYVTHAQWFGDGCLAGTRLVLARRFTRASDVSADLRMADWSWPEKRPPVFPILELRPRP